ncbi:MAG TPA: LysM peptidoglycan-binding domain-containing protein [Luteolibacter sp.]
MKPVLWIFASCVIALTFSSCGNSGGSGNPGSPQAVTGPYDRNGNYVEAWADDPSKWRKSGGSSPHERKSDELPQIAVNEQPPQNAVPLPSNSAKPTPVISQTEVTSKPKTATAKSREVATKSTRSTGKSEEVVARPKPKPKTTTVKSKPKPKSTRYVVKKGDSLSTIASKTGASVSAIKSANSISGSLIRPGQSLTIPKK